MEVFGDFGSWVYFAWQLGPVPLKYSVIRKSVSRRITGPNLPERLPIRPELHRQVDGGIPCESYDRVLQFRLVSNMEISKIERIISFVT